MRTQRLVLVLALVALSAARSPGQSFTFIPQDTVRTGPLGSEIVFDALITNTSQQMLTLALIRTLNALPAGWESSMCLNACLPPTTDTIFTTPEYGSSPLNPGETRSFSLHVYTATNNGTGTVRILARNTRDSLDSGVLTFHATSIPVGVREESRIPANFVLEQNYPNPFNPTTTIAFSLPVAGNTRLSVHDILGREVWTVLDGHMKAGKYETILDARLLASGVYFYRLQSGSLIQTRKLTLMR